MMLLQPMLPQPSLRRSARRKSVLASLFQIQAKSLHNACHNRQSVHHATRLGLCRNLHGGDQRETLRQRQRLQLPPRRVQRSQLPRRRVRRSRRPKRQGKRWQGKSKVKGSERKGKSKQLLETRRVQSLCRSLWSGIKFCGTRTHVLARRIMIRRPAQCHFRTLTWNSADMLRMRQLQLSLRFSSTRRARASLGRGCRRSLMEVRTSERANENWLTVYSNVRQKLRPGGKGP